MKLNKFFHGGYPIFNTYVTKCDWGRTGNGGARTQGQGNSLHFSNFYVTQFHRTRSPCSVLMCWLFNKCYYFPSGRRGSWPFYVHLLKLRERADDFSSTPNPFCTSVLSKGRVGYRLGESKEPTLQASCAKLSPPCFPRIKGHLYNRVPLENSLTQFIPSPSS